MTSDGAHPYNITTIRQLLLAAFTAEEFRRFCYDRPTFRPVVSRFGPGQGLDDMVDELITYCDTRLLVPDLLAQVRQHNPRQYARFMEPGLAEAEPIAEGGSRDQEGPGISQGWLGKPANMAPIVGVVVAVLAIGTILLVLAVRPWIDQEERATDTPVPPTEIPSATDTSPPPMPTVTPTPTHPTPTFTPTHPTVTASPTHPTVTPSPTPTATPTPTVTPTPSVTPTPTPPTPRAGATWTRPADGAVMVGVPAGEFIMGSTDGDPDAEPDEKPQHPVYLDAFWIDKYEVTNAQYRRCVEAGACQEPRGWDEDRWNAPTQPVVLVRWDDARDYATWVGGRLPTEAEWEKAARGTDGRIYPWGNGPANCYLANYYGCAGDPLPVGTHLDGASPYGALDMAGNVSEWVADWYDEDYYSRSLFRNPPGPGPRDYHVIRGGSHNNPAKYARCASRGWESGLSHSILGFRVVVAPGTSGP